MSLFAILSARRQTGVSRRTTTAVTTVLVALVGFARATASQFAFDPNGNLLAQTAENAALPMIISQPQLQLAMPGALTSFFVVAADTRGLAYQWEFNGTNILGATGDALLLTNVGATNEGLYSVVLNNSSGSVTSAPAALMIDSDGDGLPDSWEIAHFGNLNQTTTGDFDHDGVSNLQEFLDGTDPANTASALFRLTILKDGGSVQTVPSQDTYTNGQIVTLTATPLTPETFHLWTGDLLAQSNSITLVMTSNKTVFAHFTSVDFLWTNAAGGDWNVASNWQLNFVPGPDDNVIITTAVTITVNSNAECKNLTFGAAGVAPTLTGTATLAAHGNCAWTAGTMSGSGRTVIAAGGSLIMANPAAVYLDARTLENGGTILWTGAGNCYPSSGAVITNRPGALFDVRGLGSLIGSPGTPTRIDNAGLFRKSVSAATMAIGAAFTYALPFNNYGTVDIQSGDVAFSGGLNNGDILVANNATLNLAVFVFGTFTSRSNSSITGAGNLTCSSGFSDLGGLVNVSGPMTLTGNNPTVNFGGAVFCTNNTLSIDNGTVNFNGTGTIAPAVVNLTGGTLGGSMVVTVENAMSWTAGGMAGTGQTIIPPGVTLTISNSSSVSLASRTLENGGTVLWTGAGNFYPSAGAVITNRAGALFDVQGSASFITSGGTPTRIDNVGLFRKSVSAATTVFGGAFSSAMPFNNYGTVDIQTGGLAFNSGLNNGDILVANSTTLNLAVFVFGTFTSSVGSRITGPGNLTCSGGFSDLGGLVNLSGPMTVTGNNPTVNFSGTVFCTNNTLSIDTGTANFNGTGTVSPAVVNLTGGTLGGSMVVTVGHTMSWTAGGMNGTAQTIILPNASLTINNATPVSLVGRTLENGGTTVWSGAGEFYPSAGAVITNRAGALFDVQGAAAFRGSPGAVPRIDNAGTFRKSVSAGTTVVGPIYPVSFNNYGTLDIQSGVLLANSGYFCSSNSFLNCALWGTTAGATYGQLQVPGTVNLNGTLSVNLTNYYVPATNDTFAVVSAGTLNGAFAGFVYPSNQVTLSLSNAITAEVVRVLGVTTSQAVPLPPPPGIISWWRAENNALDAVGTNHGALTNGATFSPGEVGQGFLLDGTAGYVVIPDSPSLRPSSVTVEAWVKIFSTTGTQLVFAKPIGPATLDSFGLALANGAPLAAISDANGFGTFVSTATPLPLGQWNHLAYSFDGNTRQESLYVNGAMVASANAGKSMAFDTHPLLLGADIENGVPGLFLNGQIDEASIYNRALAASEIAAIYNVGSAGKQLLSVSLPVLLTPQLFGTDVRLVWTAISNTSYRLEFNPDLSASNWIVLPGDVIGLSNTASKLDTLTSSNRFYRVRVVP